MARIPAVKNRSATWLLFSLLLLGLVTDLLAGCVARPVQEPLPSAPPQVAEPAQQAVKGRLEPRRFIELSPSAPGRVAEVLVEEGQAVTEGQVLFRLDSYPSLAAGVASAQVEQLAAQVLQQSQRLRGHGQPAPAAAGTVEHRPHQRQARTLAGEPADDLHAPASLTEGALDEVRVPDAAPVLGREAQVHRQRREVVGDAADRGRVAGLPLRGEHHQGGCRTRRVESHEEPATRATYTSRGTPPITRDVD